MLRIFQITENIHSILPRIICTVALVNNPANPPSIIDTSKLSCICYIFIIIFYNII